MSRFNLTSDEIIRRALEKAKLKKESYTGDDLAEARTELNLILLELQSKNLPLSLFVEKTISLVDGQSDYVLEDTDVDVRTAVSKETPTAADISMVRLGQEEFQTIADKDTEGRPINYTIIYGNPITMRVWPVPNGSTWQIRYYAHTYPQAVLKYDALLDIAPKYLPLVVNKLAEAILFENIENEVDLAKYNVLAQKVRELEILLFTSDRERTDMFLVPKLRR